MAAFTDLRKGFELGPWQVLPDQGLLRQGEIEQRLEPMVMNVLVLLASADGDVVTADQIVEAVWGGRVTAPEAIVQKIKVLREKLHDDPKDPKFIQTIPKIGYRLVSTVTVPEAVQAETDAPFLPAYLLPMAGGVAAIAVIAFLVLVNPDGPIVGPAKATSVAVCPFENMSGPEGEVFVFGVREQVLGILSQSHDLRVIKTLCAPETLTEMGVDLIVSGSVLRAGGELRFIAQVLTPDGVVIRSENIDGPADGVTQVFGLFDRVAIRVRDVIVGESESEVTATSRPASLDAYDLYVLGERAFGKRSEPELQKAVNFFSEAIELDQNYGPAYLGIANSFLLLADYPGVDVETKYQEAKEIGDRGAELDPRIRDAVGTVYGYVHTKNFEWSEAANAFETAINSSTVNPTSYQTSSHHWYSRFLATVGRLELSLDQAIIAWQMDSDSPVLNARLGVAYHWLNDMENAQKYYSKAADQEIGSWIHNLSYTYFLMRQNRMDEATQKVLEALESYGQPTDWVNPVFAGLMNASDPESLRNIVASISLAAESGALPGNIELALWAYLQQSEKAMEVAWALQKSGEHFEVELIYLDEFRVLREHREFPELLDALGLTEYWQSIGCNWDGRRVVCDAPSST